MCARLTRLDVLLRARHLGAYAAIGSEVDPASAVEHVRSLGAATYHPGGERGALRLIASSRADLVAGPHGYAEPPGGAELPQGAAGTVLLVPGVAFAPDGRRLGRGAGEFDRLLTRYPEALRIGVAFEMQLVPSLPEEPWDQRVHLVVTESRLLAAARPPVHPAKEIHP